MLMASHGRPARSLFFIGCIVAGLCTLPLQASVRQSGKDAAKATPSTPSAVNAATLHSQPLGEPGTEDYVIGPGDVLAVTVWKDPALSGTMPVRPDGRIALPLIGEIQAAGVSVSHLQSLIVDKLQTYVSHPEVNVVVQEIHSRSFNVVGKVAKPGTWQLTRPTTVLDAIAMAGGFQEFARVTKVYILRQAENGKQQMLHFNYKKVIRGRDPSENIELQPGDTVVVP
jgi:polysaccharide export outer membrane protein